MNPWIAALEWMQRVQAQLPTSWPAELPRPYDRRFWEFATRSEMSNRRTLSDLIRKLVETPAPASMTPIQTWLFLRRTEWACQLAVLRAQHFPNPDADVNSVLIWLLVDSWETDGCIAFWSHYERGEAPHSDGPPSPFPP